MPRGSEERAQSGRPEQASPVAPTSATPAARIVRGLVIHDRRGPRRHRFTAEALQLHLPLRQLASQSKQGGWGWGLNRWALLSIHDRHHGDGRPLLNWVEAQLQAAGIQNADGEIWLYALPSSLGYVFKPVSFWFCENRSGETVAIVAEVNNTFGDRHVYVLACPEGYRDGQTLRCEKAFYVSPFCPVEGHYQFRFFRPRPDQPHALCRIEYTQSDGTRLVTSISGESVPLSQWRALVLWLRRPWTSLSVIAAIHLQALRLWLKRIPLVPRPQEVL